MSKPKKLRKLIKAAKMGKPFAMYQLGLCYESGKYMEQNIRTAAEWISCAAEAGYAPAIEWMNDYKFDDNADVQANS